MHRLAARSLQVLEWPRIIAALSERARSPLGRACCETLNAAPTEGAHAANRARTQNMVGECRQIQATHSAFHGFLADTLDPREFFDLALKDGTLDPQQVHVCGHFMATCGLVASELDRIKEVAPALVASLAELPKRPRLCDDIDRSVNSLGEILDTASRELADLRTARASKRLGFEKFLQSRVNDWHRDGILQDNYYDVLDGRFVVPLRSDRQASLSGSLHSRSQTRQSLFIEPNEFMAANNELQEMDQKIRTEEWRILRDLSGRIAEFANIYDPWVERLAELDYWMAAARLAEDWRLRGAVETGTTLRTVGLIHPLLPLTGVEPVANDLALDGGRSILIISGPNTGGKTVFIKAVALASLMAGLGLPIAAEENSAVPTYAGVAALIGDEQDLSGGLSSFSAQLKDLQELLTIEGGPWLVIIDEILSSTDPEEAAALAQAVLERLQERGHHVLVTTHFSLLAARARALTGMGVAAMEFRNGRPSFRLRVDETGSSHALDVAQRLGFPGDILTRAQTLISNERQDYDRAMKALQTKEEALAAENRASAAALEQDYAQRRQRLDEEREHFSTQYAAFAALAEKRLSDTVAQMEERVKSYERQGVSSAPQAMQRLQQSADEVAQEIEGEALKHKRQLTPSTATNTASPLREPAPGDQVKVRTFGGNRGRILSIEGRMATIQVGALRIQRPMDELEWLETTAGAPHRPTSRATAAHWDTSAPASRTLDLRGKRYDEAVGDLEQFLDQAFRSGSAQVKIVTGHGTGAVKTALKEVAGRLPYIKEVRPERAMDDGAFLVEFDS